MSKIEYKITVSGFGAVMCSTPLPPIEPNIIKIKGFCGYHDMPPIRFMVFMTEEGRDTALDILGELNNKEAYDYFGPLRDPIEIESKRE